MNYSILNTILQNALVYCNTALPENQLTVIIRSNQGGTQPGYPYGSYLVTSSDIQKYSNRKEIANPDPTKYSEIYSRRENLNVSLTLIGNDIVKLNTIARKLYDYLNLFSRDFQQENNLKIEPLNQVQDRTIFNDPNYEYRLGFDFQVRGISVLSNTIDAVDMDATIDAVGMEIVE
jgi:hypothetical protein